MQPSPKRDASRYRRVSIPTCLHTDVSPYPAPGWLDELAGAEEGLVAVPLRHLLLAEAPGETERRGARARGEDAVLALPVMKGAEAHFVGQVVAAAVRLV